MRLHKFFCVALTSVQEHKMRSGVRDLQLHELTEVALLVNTHTVSQNIAHVSNMINISTINTCPLLYMSKCRG